MRLDHGRSLVAGLAAVVSATALLAVPAVSPAAPPKLTRVKGFPHEPECAGTARDTAGATWFVCGRGRDELVKIESSGRVRGPFRPPRQTFPAGASGAIGGLTAGPNATIWFDNGAGVVCRMSAAGAIACVRTPQSQGAPTVTETSALVPGPDGNLWMLQSLKGDGPGGVAKASIVRVTPSAQMTEFPLPDDARGGGLVAGPDGNMWVGGESTVIRVSVGGAVTSFGIPAGTFFFTPLLAFPRTTATPLPPMVAVGNGSHRVFMFGVDGTARVVADRLSTSTLLREAVTGASGDIWILDESSKAGTAPGHFKPGQLLRLSPNGTVSRVALSGRDFYFSLTAGPRAELWMLSGRVSRKPDEQLVSLDSHGRIVARRSLGANGSVSLAPDGPSAMWLIRESGSVRIDRVSF